MLGAETLPDEDVAALLFAVVSGAACSSAVWTSHLATMTLEAPTLKVRESNARGYSKVRSSPGERAKSVAPLPFLMLRVTTRASVRQVSLKPRIPF